MFTSEKLYLVHVTCQRCTVFNIKDNSFFQYLTSNNDYLTPFWIGQNWTYTCTVKFGQETDLNSVTRHSCFKLNQKSWPCKINRSEDELAPVWRQLTNCWSSSFSLYHVHCNSPPPPPPPDQTQPHTQNTKWEWGRNCPSLGKTDKLVKFLFFPVSCKI